MPDTFLVGFNIHYALPISHFENQIERVLSTVQGGVLPNGHTKLNGKTLDVPIDTVEYTIESYSGTSVHVGLSFTLAERRFVIQGKSIRQFFENEGYTVDFVVLG